MTNSYYTHRGLVHPQSAANKEVGRALNCVYLQRVQNTEKEQENELVGEFEVQKAQDGLQIFQFSILEFFDIDDVYVQCQNYGAMRWSVG